MIIKLTTSTTQGLTYSVVREGGQGEQIDLSFITAKIAVKKSVYDNKPIIEKEIVHPKSNLLYFELTPADTSKLSAGKFSGAQLAYDAEGNIFIRKANGTPILDGTLNVVSQMSWYHLDDTDVDLQYFLSSLTSTEGTAIPLATRMPALPTDTGTYALKCINGFPQWEYEGGAE